MITIESWPRGVPEGEGILEGSAGPHLPLGKRGERGMEAEVRQSGQGQRRPQEKEKPGGQCLRYKGQRERAPEFNLRT